jgi:L-rhamnose isomerase
LTESLDAIFKPPVSKAHNLDSVEPKLFGIGSESYVAGSHEFYIGYAITRKKLLTLDAGHYHPTESIADKISSLMQFLPGMLLHVSRGVRWDSDHVVTLSDDLLAIAREITANDYLSRVRIGLDYFDASINRVAAWVIGTRNMLRALLAGLLEPPGAREMERAGDLTSRLALQEEAKTLPLGAVWDHYCEKKQVPVGPAWVRDVKRYERDVLSRRV